MVLSLMNVAISLIPPYYALFANALPSLLLTIILLDCLFFLRVFKPRAGLPQGVHGPGRPIAGLTFTTTMWMVIRVHNRTTNSRSDTHVTFTSCFTDVDQVRDQRFQPVPTVARQLIGTILISPDGSLSVAYFPSLAISCALLPAERTSCPPLPGYKLNVVYLCTYRNILQVVSSYQL